MKKHFRYFDFLVVSLMAIVLMIQLMMPPIIGLANNGDFERIMAWGGLSYKTEDFQEKYFNYINREFNMNESHVASYVSSEVLFLKIALLFNHLVISSQTFDIRSMGFVHAIFLLAAMLLLLRGVQKQNLFKQKLSGQILIAILLFVSFIDVGYFAYFNSFYSENASLIFLLVMFGFALHLFSDEYAKKPNYWLVYGFFLTIIFLVLAKVQNALLGLILPLFGWRLLKLYAEKKWKLTVTICSAVIFLISLVMASYNPYNQINIYQTVFNGILKDSPTVEKDLAELGIDKKYALLAGTNYFTPNKPFDIQGEEFKREYYDNINKKKVVLFYLKHPIRFFEKLDVVAQNSLNMEFYLGNYEKSENKSPLAVSHEFSQWTWILKTIIPKSIWFMLLFAIGFVVVLIREYRKSHKESTKRFAEFLLMIVFMAITQFVTPLLGDGESDLAKHLFLFNVLFSLMLIISIVWLVQTVNKGFRNQTYIE